MLRSAFIAVDAIGKAHPIIGFGIVAMQAMRGDEQADRIGAVLDIRMHSQIVRVAQGMCVLCAEMGQFDRLDLLDGLRQHCKMMAKARCKSSCLQIARVNEKFERVAFGKGGKNRLFKRLVDERVHAYPLIMPRERNVGESLLAEQLARIGQSMR